MHLTLFFASTAANLFNLHHRIKAFLVGSFNPSDVILHQKP